MVVATGSDDVVVVSTKPKAVSIDGGTVSLEDASTTQVTTSGDVTTTLHVRDDFGTPPPSPPPLQEEANPAVEKQLKELESTVSSGSRPSHERLTVMVAALEELPRKAMSFEQRIRLQKVEEMINKAHKGTHLLQHLTSVEAALKDDGDPAELRSKMAELAKAIQEAGPQADNHPHVVKELEKRLDSIDDEINKHKARQEADTKAQRERRERERKEDPMYKDRQRAHQAALRRSDVTGRSAPSASSGASSSSGRDVGQLRAKIARMRSEGGDDLVISALEEKLDRLRSVPGVESRPRPSLRNVFRGASFASQQDDDEDDGAKASLMGRRSRKKSDDDDDDDDSDVIIVKRRKKSDS